jgi:hypothetical protein
MLQQSTAANCSFQIGDNTMIYFRPHDGEKEDHPTDANGRTYVTIDITTAQQYTDRARTEGETLFVAGGTGVSDPNKLDMLVTETDSIGLEMPTKKHGPGY